MSCELTPTPASVLCPTGREVLITDTLFYTHPDDVQEWLDDTREWPDIRQLNIADYLLSAKACDFREVCNYKALESYNYLQSGWVGKVLIHSVNDEVVLLKGSVTPSQAVSSKSHHPWVSAKRSGEILRAGCTCMAGQARVCSHVGAVLWKVEYAVTHNLSGRACTDIAAVWNKGTKRNVEPTTIEGINFKLQRGTVDPVVQQPRREMQAPLSKEEIKKMHRDSGYFGLFNIPGTLLHETLNAPPRPSVTVEDDPEPHADHNTSSELPTSCVLCNIFYERFVKLSSVAAAVLEKKTKSQDSSVWYMSRCIRLRASNIKKVPKKSSTPCTNAVNSIVNSSFTGTAATKHGRKYEPLAREQFVKTTGLSVMPCGTFVSPDAPWLSASPDGLVNSDEAILEVKCPFVMDCVALVKNGKYDVKFVGGNYILVENGPGGYHGQVQFQMYCTSRKLCYFYVWSLRSDILVKVPFQGNFVFACIPRLRKFYFVHLLPEVVNHYKQGKLSLCQAYIDLCEL